MSTDTEFKDFIIKHRAEILKNDWESIYNDFSEYDDVSSLTDFLLNKAHINPLFYMRSVPENFAEDLDIKSINIPNNITSIDDFAFLGCSKLTSITISSSVTSIGSAAFEHCSSLISITIPNSVTKIGSDAFYNCSSLTSINIPNSVISVKTGAFNGCTSLTSIIIPNSVKTIEYEAFYSCDNLKEIKYTGNQQQWDKLLAKNEDFAEWIRENKVKIIFI